MTPELWDYRTSCARWRIEHRNIPIEVSHHGISDWNPSGTWCYYLIIDQRLFQRAEDWSLFDRPVEVKQWGSGSFHEHFPYDEVPDLNWHGGPTYGERRESICRKTGKPYTWLKIGCDYGHAFDRDAGYPYTLEWVMRDAKRSADVLCDGFPQNERCGYSGLIAHPVEFYTAANGARVHASHIDGLKADGWDAWLPADPAALAAREKEGR